MKIKFLFISCLIVLASCTAKATSTPIAVPTMLKSQNQESNACILVSSPDIEKTLGFKVAHEQVSFDNSLLILDGEKLPFYGDDVCRVYSVSDEHNFIMMVIYSHTSVNANNPVATFTPSEWFEFQRQALQKELGAESSRLYDLNNIGDESYFVEGTAFREIHIFKSDVEYVLVTPIEKGVSSDVLIKVAEVIESQIP